MRRWMKISVAVAVVVCLGGWFAKPYAQDWWVARQACAGALPSDAVQQLTPEDDHLTDTEAQQVDGLGSYRCQVTVEDDHGDDHTFLEATAYTQRDDQDREFKVSFHLTGLARVHPLPEGLPGFVDKRGVVRLLLPCPDLGKDRAGRKRTMLVSTDLGYDATLRGAPRNAYQVAVAFAGSASGRLGCGAEPLDLPEGGQRPASHRTDEEDPGTVSLSQVKDTPCGWLTHAGLPQNTAWQVAVRANGSAPVSRCVVFGGGYGDGDKLVFAGWYGDWSNRLGAFHGIPGTLTAAARCGGQAANYKLMTSEDAGIDADLKQQLLEAFVRDEARRHDCSDLRFPE